MWERIERVGKERTERGQRRRHGRNNTNARQGRRKPPTPEEAVEVHKEYIRTQEEIQEEIQRKDHEREARQHAYPPLPIHPVYNATSNHARHVAWTPGGE
jgi:hypothetical protein